MADRGGEFSFFQVIHVRIDIRISRRPMITKFGKQVHLQVLILTRLMKQVLETSLNYDHVTN